MAHRIAELITLAENADADAANELQEAASKAILDLWDHRRSWPRGWPPSGLNVTEALREHTQYPWSTLTLPKRPTWLDALGALRRIHKDEEAVWLDRALLECPVAEAQEWLDQHGERMDEVERASLVSVIEAARKAQARRFVSADSVEEDDTSDTESNAAVLEAKIGELGKARQKLRRSIVPGWPSA